MGYYIRQHIFCGGRGRGDFQLKRKGYKENTVRNAYLCNFIAHILQYCKEKSDRQI